MGVFNDTADLPTDLRLHVQILSCSGLRKRDGVDPNPYLKVVMGGREVHELMPAMKTANPVYESVFKSKCVIRTSVSALVRSNGLDLLVKDWDHAGNSNDLGSVRISANEL